MSIPAALQHLVEARAVLARLAATEERGELRACLDGAESELEVAVCGRCRARTVLLPARAGGLLCEPCVEDSGRAEVARRLVRLGGMIGQADEHGLREQLDHALAALGEMNTNETR